MSAEKTVNLTLPNYLELHYFFFDDSHSMDAVVQNQCEYEFLGLLKQIAATLDSNIIIETEPLAEGGLRRWFRLVAKEESHKAIITTAVVTSLATSLIVTPVSTTVSKVTEQIIENIFEDKKIKALEKEKLKLEVEKLKSEIKSKAQSFDENIAIRKKKSNFFQNLEKYPKVKKISFISKNENGTYIVEEKVKREDFKKFVLVSDKLDPCEIENATVEIISPVLKKGNYKWLGVYEGESISFKMKSKDFKALVQTGKIQFKNGTSINCHLVIKKKIDNEGVEKITGYDVIRVDSYFENDKPIETGEGRKFRQKKEINKMQTDLFAEEK